MASLVGITGSKVGEGARNGMAWNSDLEAGRSGPEGGSARKQWCYLWQGWGSFLNLNTRKSLLNLAGH